MDHNLVLGRRGGARAAAAASACDHPRERTGGGDSVGLPPDDVPHDPPDGLLTLSVSTCLPADGDGDEDDGGLKEEPGHAATMDKSCTISAQRWTTCAQRMAGIERVANNDPNIQVISWNDRNASGKVDFYGRPDQMQEQEVIELARALRRYLSSVVPIS